MSPEVLIDDGRSLVTYQADYLPAEKGVELLCWCANVFPWKAETYSFGGKAVETRRKSCAFGTPGLTYRYSGVTREAHPLPPAIGVFSPPGDFNFVLANFYPDGRAGIGAHADDEPDIVPASPIAAVSLGAKRRLVLTDKKTGQRAAEVVLEHGSLLVMSGETQKHFKHSIPAQPSVKEIRISLTYRSIRVAP